MHVYIRIHKHPASEQTVTACNRNSLFRMDPRIGGKDVVASHFTYKGAAPKLSCVATTGKGGMAVGSKTGEIRMFNKVRDGIV